MDLSIIIVNYNTKKDLGTCLDSIDKTKGGLDLQIIVVDNRSMDASVAMIEQKYRHVELIANEENLGFAAANNQGIRRAKGRYILLLNPDTIVYENTLQQCISVHGDSSGSRMPRHKDADRERNGLSERQHLPVRDQDPGKAAHAQGDPAEQMDP